MEYNDSSSNNFLSTGHSPLLVGVTVLLATIVSLMYLYIVLSVVFTRRLRTQSNCFLVSLFLDEILLILAVTVSSVLILFHHDNKILICVVTYANTTGISGYFLNCAVVAADRYFKIARPMHYMNRMSGKVCAIIILAVWVLSITTNVIPFTGLPTAEHMSMYELFLNQTFRQKAALLFNIYALPCLILHAAFVIGLVVIARNQQRKIEAERINLGNVAADNLANGNNRERPQRARSSKSTWYLCIHFAAIIIAWVPTVVSLNVFVSLLKLPKSSHLIVIFALTGISGLQMILGGLFLVYSQKDHKEVLCNVCKCIKSKFKC